jgi:hypothetical protein
MEKRMFRIARFAVLLAFVSIAAAQAEAPDYFAPRTAMDANTAMVLDAWSGQRDVVEGLRARLAQSSPPANAYDGWSFLCGFEYHTGAYAQAIPDCEKAIALNADGGDANTLAIVKLVADQPPPRAYGSARVPVTSGVHVPVKAGDYGGLAIADTGAQVSVMMQSVAQAAHVKMLGASKDVGSTTATVSGQVGLIPEVMIGDAVVKNIPVLVLPDAQLTITDGKKSVSLPFILSLYALADFGRVAWLDHDKWLALGGAAPASFPGAVPMIWHPQGIAVPLEGPGGVRAAQFDSGADVSYLYENAVPLVSNAERATIIKTKRKIGGVGGVVIEDIRRFPTVAFTLAGQKLVLKDADIAKQPDSGEAARLGEDVLRAYSAVVFDFGAMTFSVSP